MTAPLGAPDQDWLAALVEEAGCNKAVPPDAELDGVPGIAPVIDDNDIGLIPYHRLGELQTLAWQRDGLIPGRSVSTIFADPGVGKTFLIISLAVAAAAGIDWGDRGCSEAGGVVLVVGEGIAGIPKRITAAVRSAGLGDALLPIYLLPEPLNLLDGVTVRRFIAALNQLPDRIVWIVFDTFITCTLGADQNNASEMAAAYEHLKLIARELCTAVTTTDHPNNTSKGRPAGSYVKVASADAIWQAERDGERIVLTATKLKDFARDETEMISLRLAKVAGTDSVAIKHVDEQDGAAVGHGLDRVCLRALDSIALDGGATTREWLEAAEEEGCSRASFYRGRKRLLRGHLVEELGKRFRLTPGGQLLVSGDAGIVS